MRRVATGTVPVPGQNAIYTTITVQPQPEATPAGFAKELKGSNLLKDMLIDVVVKGDRVVVTLVDFEITKWTIQQLGRGLIKQFGSLLPETV